MTVTAEIVLGLLAALVGLFTAVLTILVKLRTITKLGLENEKLRRELAALAALDPDPATGLRREELERLLQELAASGSKGLREAILGAVVALALLVAATVMVGLLVR